MPLHAWLPLAHPAAPSHVSALMSGMMTKVAVYGFVRVAFDLTGAPAWWWSIVVLALGGATAVMGVLYALMQRDIKQRWIGFQLDFHIKQPPAVWTGVVPGLELIVQADARSEFRGGSA